MLCINTYKIRTENFNFIPVKRNYRYCIGYKKRFLVFIRVSLDILQYLQWNLQSKLRKTKLRKSTAITE